MGKTERRAGFELRVQKLILNSEIDLSVTFPIILPVFWKIDNQEPALVHLYLSDVSAGSLRKEAIQPSPAIASMLELFYGEQNCSTCQKFTYFLVPFYFSQKFAEIDSLSTFLNFNPLKSVF